MIEFNDDIPFLWRLSSHDSEGFCVVSMVVPFNDGDSSLEHTIETDVMSFASDICSYEEEELEWNEDDLNLFLKLIANHPGGRASGGETIRVDLADPATIEIIHIVAAAGFGMALPSDDILAYPKATLLSCDFDIGSTVSISTVEGYKRCVVVDLDEDDVVCVILDKVSAQASRPDEDINPYDLLLLKRSHVLHPEYTSLVPGGVLH